MMARSTHAAIPPRVHLGDRRRKGTRFQRVDALESFNLEHVTAGNDFTCAWECSGNGGVGFGANQRGQLGVSDREEHMRPKAMSRRTRNIQLCQLQSGEEHSIALSSSGDVLVWGSGREGQMGTGQYTSLAVPTPVAPLLKRPIVQVAAGTCGSFCLAVTASGILYSWGENNAYQLGHGDTKPRTRPDVVAALRVARVKSIAAGQHHTVAVSHSGQLFSWGKNTSGQCGQGKKLGEKQNSCPTVEMPRIVDRFRDIMCNKPHRTFIKAICCGIAHSVVLLDVPQKDTASNYVSELYAFGNNTSGQLGLGTLSRVLGQQRLTHFLQDSILFPEFGVVGTIRLHCLKVAVAVVVIRATAVEALVLLWAKLSASWLL